MERENSPLQDDPPEALMYAEYRQQRKQLSKKSTNATPKQVAVVEQESPKKTAPKAEKEEVPERKPKVKAEATTRDRSSIPREQMSGHRVGTDIPKRIRHELNHRLDNDIKTTLAEVTDDILNVGLEYYEKKRKR